MSLQCAISGEPLTPNNAEEVVVTPSGHLCFKRLLLTKLSENGGVDPFSDSDRPLSEDQLVPLQISKNRTNMPPPPSSVSSFSGTLQQISKEYDAVLLELFDTRKALQETRRELSQALYQNDAAIRVIARLSMERDSARQETQQFQAAAATAVGNGNQDGQGPTKKAKIDESAPLNDADLPLADDVPAGDLEVMLATWEKLHQARKSRAKSSYSLSTNWKVSNTQSWHKSTCKGIKAMAKCDKWIASAGKDKSIVVYDYEENVVAANISPKVLVDAIDIMPKEGAEGSLMIVAGCGSEVRVYDSSREELHGRVDMGSTIIHVDSHPTGKHCVGVTADGRIGIFSIGSSGIQHISTFAVDGTEYASGALHPDGLIFAAGTTKGQLFVWDFKNKNLAAKIPVSTLSSVLILVHGTVNLTFKLS